MPIEVLPEAADGTTLQGLKPENLEGLKAKEQAYVIVENLRAEFEKQGVIFPREVAQRIRIAAPIYAPSPEVLQYIDYWIEQLVLETQLEIHDVLEQDPIDTSPDTDATGGGDVVPYTPPSGADGGTDAGGGDSGGSGEGGVAIAA